MILNDEILPFLEDTPSTISKIVQIFLNFKKFLS